MDQQDEGDLDGLDFPGLDVEDFDPKLFQGAPLMARIDAGDSFDNMLQAWLLNGQSLRQNQQYQDYPVDLSDVPGPQAIPSASIDPQPGLYNGGLESPATTAMRTVGTADNGPSFSQGQDPNSDLHYQQQNVYASPAMPGSTEFPARQAHLPNSQSTNRGRPVSATQYAGGLGFGAPHLQSHTTSSSEAVRHSGQELPFSQAPMQNQQPWYSSQHPCAVSPRSLQLSQPLHIAPEAVGMQRHQPATHPPQSHPSVIQPASQQLPVTPEQPAMISQFAKVKTQDAEQQFSHPSAYQRPGHTGRAGTGSGRLSDSSQASAGFDPRVPSGITSAGQASASMAYPALDMRQEGNSPPQSRWLPDLPPLQSVAPTVEEAQKAWEQPTKRKRGPMSAASKEKERARNRRAQRKFREREKERQEERQNALALLEAQLAKVKEEKDELTQQNIELQAKAVKATSESINKQALAPFDGELFIDTQAEEMKTGFPTHLTRSPFLQDVRLQDIDYKTYGKVYRRYVEGLHTALVAAKPDSQERMIALIHELCDLNLYLALQKEDFAKFICCRLDGDAPVTSQAPIAVWRRCLNGLMLSQEQRQAMLATRKEHLSKLRPILRDRAELHRLVAACGAESTPFNQRSESNFKMLDAVDRLKKNLHKEQGLLVQTLCASHQKLLAPEQTAMNIVLAYPYYPDVPMLVDLIASETPGEQTASEILALEALPL